MCIIPYVLHPRNIVFFYVFVVENFEESQLLRQGHLIEDRFKVRESHFF